MIFTAYEEHYKTFTNNKIKSDKVIFTHKKNGSIVSWFIKDKMAGKRTYTNLIDGYSFLNKNFPNKKQILI